jgi:hypothetical protein
VADYRDGRRRILLSDFGFGFLRRVGEGALPRCRFGDTPRTGRIQPSKKIFSEFFSWGETAYDGVAFGRNG